MSEEYGNYKLNKQQLAEWKQLTSNLRKKARENSRNDKEDPVERKRRLNKCRWNYQFFVDYYFEHYTTNIPLAKFHIETAEKIKDTDKIDACLMWHRGAAKSVNINIFMPIWLMINRKHIHNVVLISATKESAVQQLLALRAEFAENKRLIEDWNNGESFRADKDVTWRGDQFIIDVNGWDIMFTAVGKGTSIRGIRHNSDRVDYLIADDITGSDYLSPDLCEKDWSRLVSGAFFTDDPNKPFRVIFCENGFSDNNLIRKYEDRLNNYVKRGGDPDRVLISKINVVNEKGEINWKERFSQKWLDDKKLMDPIYYDRELMQKFAISGKYFKERMIQFRPILPLHQYTKIISYYDPSISAMGDYKSVAVVGIRSNNTFDILDMFVKKCHFDVVLDYLFEVYEKYPHILMYIENVFSQETHLLPYIKEKEIDKGVYLPLIKDKFAGGSGKNKKLRIESILPYMIDEVLFFNEALRDTMDFEEGKIQLLSFSFDSGYHDDFPDSLAAALFHLNKYRKINGNFNMPKIIKTKHNVSF